MASNDIYLQHHGILGMKWGRRKDRTKQAKNRKNLRNAAVAGGVVAAGRTASLLRMGRAVQKKYGHNPYHNHDSRIRAAKHVGALAVMTGLALYGTLTVSDAIDERKEDKRAS